jgi:hypothetical protein
MTELMFMLVNIMVNGLNQQGRWKELYRFSEVGMVWMGHLAEMRRRKKRLRLEKREKRK